MTLRQAQGKTKRKGAQPANDNATTHGIYSKWFTDDELSRIIGNITEPAAGIDAATQATYVLLDRIIAKISDDTTSDAESLLKLVNAHNETTGRIAHLLRSRKIITDDTADSIAGHIGGLLDQLSDVLDVKL